MTEYELHNLVAHLEACGRVDDLHRLLRLEWVTQSRHQNAWFAARARNGDVEGFSGDVARGWRVLDRELLDGRKKPELLAAQIYCALVLASLQARSSSIPTALIERLVVGEVRTTDYGLALARRNPDPAWRGKALALLMPALPAADRQPVLEEVMELIMAPDANLEYIAPALERVAPYLSAQDARNILGRLRGVRYQAARALVFAALATAMDGYELERAMSEVLECSDDLQQLALAKLARQLPERVLGAFVRRVLGWPYRAERLAAFAPHLTEPLLTSAEAEIRELTREDARTRLLAVLIPFLSLGDRQRVLPEVLRGIERLPAAKRETARAIVDVLPVLTSAQRKEYIGHFLKGCRGYTHGWEAHAALRVLAPGIPRAMRRRAIRLARAGTPEDCVRGLAALVAGMPQRRQLALAREAIKKSRGVDTPFGRAAPLVELLARFDPGAREAVFQEWLLEAEGPLAAVKAASRSQWEELWDRLAPALSPGSAAVLEGGSR